MHRFSRITLASSIFAAALLTAACSGGSHGSALLPGGVEDSAARSPLAPATPPVTAPVTIPYPYTNAYTTTTWSGPKAKPKVTKGNDDGTITVQFFLDKKTGIYLVPETIDSKLGYREVLNSAVGFLPAQGGGIAQVILSDNYTYKQGTTNETGMDTYPQGEAAPDFPLTKGRTWSGAANHTSFYNLVVSGSNAFEQNNSTNVLANGSYTGQSQSSSTNGSANQDNEASTFNVTLGGPSTYTLAEPAAGYNLFTQVFYPPNGAKTAVTSYGVKPLPYATGTVLVPTWYSPAQLNNTLYADNWQVTGPGTMPSDCGKRTGQAATVDVENSWSVDPVQGTYDTYTSTYYMASLAKKQYWFACIVETYVNSSYANGLAGGPGSWGKSYSQQVGKEILLATGATPGADALAAVPRLSIFSFVPPMRLHAQVNRMGLALTH